MSEINKPELRESDQRRYLYDAVVVLCGGLQKTGGNYYPTDYRHGDEFGMLGAGIRIVAALDLYFKRQSKNFVFSTGITEKNKAKFGEGVPPEAQVYAEKFIRILKGLQRRSDYRNKFSDIEEPVITLENRSFNTTSNIKEVLQIIRDNNWQKVAILSSKYHIPRVQALYSMALEQHPEVRIGIDFIKAEDYVEQTEPGEYDSVIVRYEKTSEAKKRYANEEQGLEAIRKGKYHRGEFQLGDNTTPDQND